MKLLVRFSVFVASFILGVLVATLSSITLWQSESQPVLKEFEQASESEEFANPPTGVRVMYSGWHPATESSP